MIHDIFRVAAGTPMTDDLLLKFIKANDNISQRRYRPLWRAYNNDYSIYHAPKKAAWRPDVRVSANFAQYIVDTFEGFFIGLPIKVTSDDTDIASEIALIDAAADSDDVNAEWSTLISIFGRAYRICYVDEYGNIGTACLDPMESFAVYDEGIIPRMLYFVRTYLGYDKIRRGSISDDTQVRYFELRGGNIIWTDSHPHGFDGVPAVEGVLNNARRGIYESVLPLIDTYNKALSEKANDVDSFGEAYLKILGSKIDEETLKFMRENRTINFDGKSASDIVVDFLQKPSGDSTQEHLLDRIETLIFTTAMVCNISDDGFATSSGIALKYKMLPMINLAAKKWRKYAAALNQYYRLVCSNPVTILSPDAWQKIKYVHMLNYPANISDEADTAKKLDGIVSKRTQLSVLSIVDDVDAEIAQIEAEAAAEKITSDSEKKSESEENTIDKDGDDGVYLKENDTGDDTFGEDQK